MTTKEQREDLTRWAYDQAEGVQTPAYVCQGIMAMADHIDALEAQVKHEAARDQALGEAEAACDPIIDKASRDSEASGLASDRVLYNMAYLTASKIKADIRALRTPAGGRR